MMRNKITQIIRICKLTLFPLFFLSVSSSGEVVGEKMSVNQFRVGFVEVTLPISWTDVLRSQYSGRILSDFCFHNDDIKANGVVLEIFTWQKLWKTKDLFLKSYDSVEDLAKTNPQFLAGKNYGHTEFLVGNGIVRVDLEPACNPVSDGLEVDEEAVAARSCSGLL
jgi:hypothetical protein